MKSTLDYSAALDLLRHPATWKKGARALSNLKDPRALLHLVRAYELHAEISRLPLLDAMERLGAAQQAARLYASAADDEERRLALHLMELFPNQAHLPALAQAAQSAVPGLRGQAGRSLVCQPYSPDWQAVMVNLLESPDERVRNWAQEGLRLSGHRPNQD